MGVRRQFVQYDEGLRVIGCVWGETAPDRANQIEVPDGTPWTGLVVDPILKVLAQPIIQVE